MTSEIGLLLTTALRSGLLLVCAGVFCVFLRKSSAALRHLIWSLAIVGVLILPVFSALLPVWQVEGVPRVLATQPPVLQTLIASVQTPEIAASPKSLQPITVSGARTGSDLPARVDSSPTLSVSKHQPSLWKRLLPLIPLLMWGIGALVVCGYSITGIACVRLLRQGSQVVDDPEWRSIVRTASAQLGLHRKVTLLLSPVEVVPMLWGVWRSIILLPASATMWSVERRRLVILHELAHARRADCLTQAFGQLACAVYWFNPLIWLTASRLRRERELACDDLILQNGMKGSDYAEHLLDIAKSLRHPACAQAVAVAMSRRAGIETRIRAVLDPGRNRRGVTRPVALIAVVCAIPLLTALAVARAAQETAGGHTAARMQWQPTLQSTPHDARLDQRLTLDIVGRAAVPTLAILSKKSGVSLAVAPEDLKTVGERKLTIFARDLSLIGLMVQIPEALQECHWDIVEEAGKPRYLLHRNAGATNTIEWLSQRERRNKEVEGRPAREARVEAAWQAMTMTPDQLAELEKTDLMLARSMKNQETRAYLEAFLALPNDRMEQFLDTGRIELDYGDLPAPLQEKVQSDMQKLYDSETRTGDAYSASYFKTALERLSGSTLEYWDQRIVAANAPFDVGFTASVVLKRVDSTGKEVSSWALGNFTIIHGTNPNPIMDGNLETLLRETGTPNRRDAHNLLSVWRQSSAEIEERKTDARKRREWPEPTNPDLKRLVSLEASQPLELAQVQQLLATASGMSVVSDFFTDRTQPLPREAVSKTPLWRVLYALSEQWNVRWQKAGSCLTFRHVTWFDLSKTEMPESMVRRFREKLQREGHLSLDDAAAVKVSFPGLPREYAFPRDLQNAGLTYSNLLQGDWALRLYAALLPRQIAQANKPEGLPLAEMAITQRHPIERMIFDSPSNVNRVRFYIQQNADRSGGATYILSLRMPGDKTPKVTTTLTFQKVAQNRSISKKSTVPGK